MFFNRLRACLHGVRDRGLVGSGGHKTRETYPTRSGSPTPCKQGLKSDFVLVRNFSRDYELKFVKM